MTSREGELEARVVELEMQNEEFQKLAHTLHARTAVAWMGLISTKWMHRLQGDTYLIRNLASLAKKYLSEGYIEKAIQMLESIDQVAVRIQEVPTTSSELLDKVEVINVNEALQVWLDRRARIRWLDDVRVIWNIDNDEDLHVRINEEWLFEVIDLLVDNAINAMSGSKLKNLTIRTEASDASIVRIHIKDTGCGIPCDVLPNLFKEPIQKAAGETGRGMGLLVASTIIATYNGDIRVDYTSQEGSSFIVSLPLVK